jgi:hypothetical protein
MKRTISIEELFKTIPPRRALEMIAAAGDRGKTFPEIIDAVFPELDAKDADRLGEILERKYRSLLRG